MQNIKILTNKLAFISDVHWDNRTPMSRLDDILLTLTYKFEDIIKKCLERGVHHVVFEGDLLNRAGLSYEGFNSLARVLKAFKEANIEAYCILGNHDLQRNNEDMLNRSPIQTLFISGLLTHINSSVRLIINDSVCLRGFDYLDNFEQADKDFNMNIAVIHAFINANEFMSDEKHNLRTEDILQLGYDVIIAGHDHAKYPTMKIGKSLIYRHGSVLRGTAHDYNFEREPCFLVFNDLSNICESTIEEVIIEHKPYQDIASNYVLNKKQVGSISGLKDLLSNLAEKLSMSSDSDGDRILEIIKTDPELPNESRLQLLNYITEQSS